MNWRELVWSHKYADAVRGLRRHLASNPNDIVAVDWMADALRGAGEYREALAMFERLDTHGRADKVASTLAPGSPGRRIDIACLHWLLGDHAKAVQLMHDLAAGILDGSIKYGDAAGGMSQGLLLYYMAVSDNEPKQMSFALGYLRNRVEQANAQTWPCPVASYYLGDVAFTNVMERVNRRISTMPLASATLELGRRKRLCVALFHDGIKSRAQGDEARCLTRMRECYALENPVIEQEWYLARYEVKKAESAPVRK